MRPPLSSTKILRNFDKPLSLNIEVNVLFTLIKQTNCALHFVNLLLVCRGCTGNAAGVGNLIQLLIRYSLKQSAKLSR